MKKKKVEVHLAGSKTGMPTLEELIEMSKRLIGRDPTPEEIEEAKKIIARRSSPPSSPA